MRIGRRVGLVLSVLVVVVAARPARASVLSGSVPNPDDVNLALWLRADTLQLSEGAAVTRWADARGNGRGASSGWNGGGAPAYASDLLHGLPGVRFDGALRSLVVDASVRLGREHTIIVVGHARSDVEGHADTFASYRERRSCDPRVSLAVRKLGSQRALQVRYPELDVANSASSAVSAGLNGPAVLAQTRASERYVRGYVGQVTPPLIRVSESTGRVESRAAVLWVGGDAPSNALTGDVFEVLVYDRALGVNELREVFDYLNAKWLPTTPAKARVVWQSNGAGLLSAEAGSGAAHSPDAWYRDRGAREFDLLDGSLDCFARFDTPSQRWTARNTTLLEIDGGANGMSFAIRRPGPRKLEARIAAKDGAGAQSWTLVAAAENVAVVPNVLYHLAFTLATNPADGRVTARLFAAPQNTPIDVSQDTFEIARALAPPLDDPHADPAARACAPSAAGVSTSLTDHAFRSSDGLRWTRGFARIERARVWRGVPRVFDAAATYPDVERSVAPRPEPAYPSAFDPFSPPVAATPPARGAPAIAEWTRSANAGDSVALTGEQLTGFDGDDAGKDTRFAVFGQSAESRNLVFASVQRLEARRGVIGLDETLPPGSMYFVWPGNQQGYGRPVAVNQTEAWWLGPDRATRGDVVHVFGRNLSHDAGTSTAYLYLKPTGQASGRWLAPTTVNPYRVGFTVPSDLPNGSYELWAHNGHGGRYGWSKPRRLTIDAGITWSGATIDVAANGADALADDDAIQAALLETGEAAKTSGARATVRFPEGLFLLTRTLFIPSNVRIIGAGKGKTVLRGLGNFAATAHLVWFERTQNNEIANLTLDFGAAIPNVPEAFVMAGFAQSLRIRDVRLIALNDDKQKLTYLNANGAQFSAVDFLGPQATIVASTQVTFDRCNFFGVRGGVPLVAMRGVSELSVTRCTAQDYNAADDTNGAGWTQGRFVNIVNGNGISRDVYIAENTTLDLGVHRKFPSQNTGEQIAWDEAVGQPIATVARATNDLRDDSSTLQLTAAPHPLDPVWSYIAVVVSGRGEGQSRDVTAVDGVKVHVAPAWNVVPDSTSRIALGGFHERGVVYRNRLDGKAAQVLQPSHIASAGIEPFGGVSNLISDGNVVSDVRFGLYAMGEPAAPTLFNLYANNFVIGSRYAYAFDARGDASASLAVFGQVFRGNTVASSSETTGYFSVNAWPGNVDMSVFDRNVSTDTPAGYVFHDWGQPSAAIGSLVIVGDYVDRGTAPRAGSYAMNAPTARGRQSAFQPYLRGTVWANFANAFVGKWLVGPETPDRRLTASARLGGEPVQVSVPLLNGSSTVATYALTLQPSAAWSTIPQPRLELAPQAEGVAVVTCDPRGLRAGTYETTLYIEGVEPKRAVSIQLTVLP